MNPEDGITREENRAERSEVLLRFLDITKNIEALHGKSVDEVFDTEEHKREFIRNITSQEFIDLLNGLNGILRDKPQEKWDIDGKFVGIRGATFLSPFVEDKPELLAEVLAAAQRMNESNKDLKDIAILVSSSIGAIHPYVDGNGRTSRLTYKFLTQNIKETPEEDFKQVLSDNGRDIIDVSPGWLQQSITDIVAEKVGVHDTKINPENVQRMRGQKFEFHDSINEDQQEILKILLKQDRQYLFLALFEFLKDNPERDKYFVEIGSDDVEADFKLIDMNILLPELIAQDLDKVIMIYRNLKKDHVKVLIDSIENPDKSEYQEKYGKKEMSFKDIIGDRIDRVKMDKEIEESLANLGKKQKEEK